jgi:hypothetical protein
MQLKISTSIKIMSPQIVLALCIANDCYRIRGFNMVVTSVSDSIHSKKSLHYSGFAADLRTNGIEKISVENIKEDIRQRLTTEFDVILEVDHIHIEYDPKT